MNRMAEFSRAEEFRVRRNQADPLNDSETWMREKIEGWRTANRNASDLGRGLMWLVVFVNAAAVMLFLWLARSGTLTTTEVIAIGNALDFCLLGIVVAMAGAVTGWLMHRAVLETATLDIVETWRNLSGKENSRRKRARGSATVWFWITANLVILSLILFVQGAWTARNALL